MQFARGLHDISKNKKLFADAPFLLGPSARPYPLPPQAQFLFGQWPLTFGLWVMWTMWTTSLKLRAHARCGQCGQLFFFCPLCPPFRLFLFAWEFPAWTFVDNVDIVDALFKLVPDEVST